MTGDKDYRGTKVSVKSSRWKSSPLIPWSLHVQHEALGPSGGFLRKKASAESKLSTCKPTVLIETRAKNVPMDHHRQQTL